MMEQNVSPSGTQNGSGELLAWHFVDEALRDGRPVPADGEKLAHGAAPSLCVSGLHASERILDALKYAPGNTICRVECEDLATRQDDKLVCATRTVLWRVDGEDLLREFARKVALDVADLWDIPPGVRKFLETGNENFRVAARAEARDLSRAYARDDNVPAAAAAEAARAAAARTHAARATGLAAAWAANRARGDAETWARYNAILEALVETARTAEDSDDEWGDFADELEMDMG
ncbi:hypothetical protein [Nisaea sp.]|uniref:DUF7666 domain-containing protein n=2 Tax=Nisaea sp. TaxID=2024842 RepID=UPI0032675C96